MKKILLALSLISSLLIVGCITPSTDHSCNKEHYSSFLFDNAATRVMNVLSYQKSEDGFKQLVARCKANGDTYIYLYLANAGDGNPPKTSMYVNDQHAGTVDQNKVNMMRSRIEYCRKEGLCVIAWLFPDDSSSITRKVIDGVEIESHSDLNTNKVDNAVITKASFDKQYKYIDDVVVNFNDIICGYCMGIELNEYFNDAQVAQLVSALKGKVGNKSVGVHWTIGKNALCGADTLYFQYGFGLNVSKIRSMTANEVNKLGLNARFIAAEYSKDSDKGGKELGQAAMQNGANGVGNGH